MGRRGGGGSFDSSGSSSSGGSSIDNRCADSMYFLDPIFKNTAISELAIAGVALLGFIVLFGLYIWRQRRRKHTLQIAAWYSYGLALIFALM
jgi:hypothetical protein